MRALEVKYYSQQVKLQWTAKKCQRDRVDWWSNQKLFHHHQHAKIIQSICSIHQIICEIHLILDSHDLKRLAHFGAYAPNDH